MTTKMQTQIRAELCWLWQRNDDSDTESLSGAVQSRTYKTDVENDRIEGVWKDCGVELAPNASVNYQLNYLTRPTLGGTIDLAFLDVRAIIVVNRGTGTLVVEPGESNPWTAPWNGQGANVVPPAGVAMFCAGSDPWHVTILANSIAVKAVQGEGQFDIAIVGKIANPSNP